MKGALGILVGLSLALGLAFTPRFADTTTFWWLVAVPLWVAASFAVWQLSRTDALGRLFRIKGGDLTLGAAVALVLLLATWFGRTSFVALGTPRQVWLFQVYLQLGDPDRIQTSVLMTALLISIAVAEELIFRGYLQESFEARFGERRGWMVAALAYALVMAPTLWTLRAEGVGPNPLLFLTALLGGLALSFLRRMTGRLPPVLVAQAAFTYFSVLQFRLPGL